MMVKMKRSVIIHILKECNLACNLCYACSPQRLDPIQSIDVEKLVKRGFLIEPHQLSKTILEIPKKYDIFLRGGEVSLYPDWDSLFLSFAKAGHKINIDTNGQWIPKSEEEINERFFEILKNLSHKKITIYLSCDKWHEEKDPYIKERTKIFINHAEKYGLNFFIFATGIKEKELKEYYKDLNIDFNKVRFNPHIYKLGRRKNDKNAVEYSKYKENEVLVIDSNGDTYPDLQSCAEKRSTLMLGNIKINSTQELIEKIKSSIDIQTQKDFLDVPLLKGWGFKLQDYKEAWENGKLLNASIETSNVCNLSCEYCFRQETGETTKVRLPGEISLEQTYKIIDEVIELGAKSIYIIGAGEPMLDTNLEPILKYIHNKNAIPILSTNGSLIDEKWIKIFQKYGVSVVIKLNSFDSKLQDELANRKGYAEKRDKGLSLLLKEGFNKSSKDKKYQTRLAINSIVCKKNKDEIIKIFNYCRENNIMPIISTFIPAGKTEKRTDLEISLKEFLELSKQIKELDKKEYGINYMRLLPYLGGVPCSQNGKFSVYINILGDIYECPGQQHYYGNIKLVSIREIFEKLRKKETNCNFGCPPRISYWKNTNQLKDK
jgi:MoaA/NifB/PqqE/SkfB family radical SAM enzyme